MLKPTQKLVTLAHILSAATSAKDNYGRSRIQQKFLQKQRRLAFGPILAEAFLDLQGTPWAKEGLTKNSILLTQDTPSEWGTSLSDPFIRYSFGRHTPPAVAVPGKNASPQASFPYLGPAGLFDLGKLLIELALNKRLEDLYSKEDQKDGRITQFTPLLAAQRLIETIYAKLGRRYGDAVRRCIYGLDVREADIEDSSFRRQFYRDVIVPLQETYNFLTQSDDVDSAPSTKTLRYA